MMITTEEKPSIGYAYFSSQVPKYEVPLQTNNASQIPKYDQPLQVSITGVTFPKEEKEVVDLKDFVVGSNPFDNDFVNQYRDISVSDGDVTMMMFQYTSIYECTIRNVFPIEVADLILEWVKENTGLYTRRVVFEDDGFRVCRNGEWRIYPYGSTLECLLDDEVVV